ncbi:TIGR02996 domain-containing protein [Frigoriglobus tundricola]|uniref:TIGR02996 domain-containing protein n=1 Tax=Frigoriglobus tundricola TaxID=2774151 RepID=A0A6M5YRF6_9BACT|nr:TIGR02996 domain-containing protein [Frigoriglobus tundricola]QJW96558.1 hypothetical protein FTUN_4115 [Frigoriglobus tundricola]
MRDAFERAIIENPDDRASYSAYADWLQEQGDPRGEFIAVQLALEDESRPKDARDALKAREAELLAEYEREWLGELAPFVFEEGTERRTPAGYVEDYSTGTKTLWERGVLSGLIIDRISTALAHALVDSPATRFVRELHLYGTMSGYQGRIAEELQRVETPKGVSDHSELFELIGSTLLANLRVFRFGDKEAEPPENGWCDCHTFLPGLEHVIASAPRIEELHLLCNEYDLDAVFVLPNLSKLRVLRAYHVGESRSQKPRYEYGLDKLASNPTFANLTHLQFHPHWAEQGDGGGGDESFIPLAQVQALLRSPHLRKLTHLQLRLSDMGDDGIRAFIASGILKQLQWLDLRHGCVTDEGAALLAACPDAKRLERIDLSRNAVTADGLAALRAAGVNAVANNPLTPTELGSREYLREGDFE